MSIENFQFGVDILNTSVSVKTKKILAKTGTNIGEGQSDSDNVEWWQHVGFASRPSNPVKGREAAQAITIRNGTFDCAIASQDLRGLDLYGQLAPGETCIYGAGGDGKSQGRILIKDNGSVNLYTRKGNDSAGDGMGVFVSNDGSINIVSHNGSAIMVEEDGAIRVFNAKGGVQVLADGSIKLASGSKIDISGSAISMGGLSAQPLALGLNTTAAIQALQVQLALITASLAAMAALSGPVLGVMLQGILAPIATPIAAQVATVVAATVPGTPASISSLRTSSD